MCSIYTYNFWQHLTERSNHEYVCTFHRSLYILMVCICESLLYYVLCTSFLYYVRAFCIIHSLHDVTASYRISTAAQWPLMRCHSLWLPMCSKSNTYKGNILSKTSRPKYNGYTNYISISSRCTLAKFQVGHIVYVSGALFKFKFIAVI